MIKPGYLFARLREMNYRQLFSTISELHKKTGKSRVWLFADILRCGLRYGAGYKDYSFFQFYDLTPAQRATYMTRGTNNRLVSMLNDRDYYHCVDDKVEFNRLYAKYVRRGWLDMRDADEDSFRRFMERREIIISKPLAESCGRGIEKLDKKDFADLHAMYEHLKQSGAALIEDCIVQHPDIAALYPGSVNTYRIVTVRVDGVPNVVYAFIRIGNGGNFVDNLNAGGITARIRLEDGTIWYPGYDINDNVYEIHPATGCRLVGYRLPFWQESMQMCLEATAVVPQLGYVGWDVAVGEDGPQLIEGNFFPGNGFLPVPPDTPNREGMLPRFRQFVKDL